VVAEGPSKAAALVEILSAVIAAEQRSTAWRIVLGQNAPIKRCA